MAIYLKINVYNIVWTLKDMKEKNKVLTEGTELKKKLLSQNFKYKLLMCM